MKNMTKFDCPPGVQVLGPITAAQRALLSAQALGFFAQLQREFNPRRLYLLHQRRLRQEALDRGELPHWLAETRPVREGSWQVLPVPEDLQNRRVEITGPV